MSVVFGPQRPNFVARWLAVEAQQTGARRENRALRPAPPEVVRKERLRLQEPPRSAADDDAHLLAQVVGNRIESRLLQRLQGGRQGKEVGPGHPFQGKMGGNRGAGIEVLHLGPVVGAELRRIEEG